MRGQLAQASPDLLRAMVTTFAEALMGAEVGHPGRDGQCGDPEAAPGQHNLGIAISSRTGLRGRCFPWVYRENPGALRLGPVE